MKSCTMNRVIAFLSLSHGECDIARFKYLITANADEDVQMCRCACFPGTCKRETTVVPVAAAGRLLSCACLLACCLSLLVGRPRPLTPARSAASRILIHIPCPALPSLFAIRASSSPRFTPFELALILPSLRAGPYSYCCRSCNSTSAAWHSMATIQIAETLRPTRSHNSGVGGGVYPIRAVSLERSRTRSRSRDARSSDLKDPEAEDAGLRQDGDFKKRQVRWNLIVGGFVLTPGRFSREDYFSTLRIKALA